MKDNIPPSAFDFARTLLVLRNYEWIQSQAAQVNVTIIPIKGIDLLTSIYAEQLDRHVSDIDLVCQNDADCLLLAERLCEEEYRQEFPFSLRPEVLASKHKVSLLSCSTTKVNVDLHTTFVTKKFFSQTIGSFNADAMARCSNGRMYPIDRWLFLAQHAAFHLFHNNKWTRDLYLLLKDFSTDQRAELLHQSTHYGFHRILMASLYHIWKAHPEMWKDAQEQMNPTRAEQRFIRFMQHFDRPFSRHVGDRIVAAYWEFAMIDHRADRLKSWLRLMFPSRGMLTNIYKIKSPVAVMLFYPLNLFISGFTSLFFWILYACVGRMK